jgi:ABC-type branched-subunit amino acid transport system substrate-binding protein
MDPCPDPGGASSFADRTLATVTDEGGLIERTRWIVPVVIALALGCAVGEARPEGPARPVGGPPVERVPEAPTVPPAEAERRAAAAMERAARAYEQSELSESLELSREVVTLYAGTAWADSALWLGARSAYGVGRYAEAREWAERYGSRQPATSAAAERARGLAELAADAQAQPAGAGVVVGAVLPRTGSATLVQYGDWVLEGIELAVRESQRKTGRSIRLVVADDGGGHRTAQAVAELERQGAVAIIGPILPQHLHEAIAARSDPRLTIVSPTIPEAPQHPSHVYSVAGGDTHGARELARYAIRTGLRDATILHARGQEHYGRAQAFVSEFEALGGRVRAVVSYESGTTTFATHMRDIRNAVGSASPFGLFVAAPDRDVPQIAPQISFYGLNAAGVQVLGDDAWASVAVRRLVPNRDLEGVVTASHLPAGRADALADPDFVAIFEQAYRRSLTNQLPALGYDAARVVIEALPNRLLTPAAVSRSFELLTGIHGATGTLSVRGGRLVRTPHLAVIRGGQLEAVPVPGTRIGEVGP